MFEQKDKEPVLSEHMKNILDRSTGDKLDSNTDEIIRYKYKIMNDLTKNEDLINALHCDLKQGDQLRDVCIFDYMRLPDLKSEVKNYVCFDVNDSGYGNPSFIKKTIIFRTVSHVSDIKTDWGVSRHDLLAAIIKNCFDWSNSLSLTLVKVQDKAGIGDKDYYFREIVYESTTPNNLRNRINGK